LRITATVKGDMAVSEKSVVMWIHLWVYIRALVSYACGFEQCNFEGCLKEEKEEKKSQDKGDLDSKQGMWDVSMARDYIISTRIDSREMLSSESERGITVAHFFVARLVSLDVSVRTGPEFADPGRGAYDPDRIGLLGDELAAIDLRPPELKEFILANREALLAEAGLLA